MAVLDSPNISAISSNNLIRGIIDRMFREGRVEVQHVIPAVVIMVAPAVVTVLALVPNIRQLAHGLRFLFIDLLQKSGIHRPAVSALPPGIYLDGFGDLALMARHDIH